MAQRMLAYLEGLSDLSLNTAAVDATSEQAMRSLVQGTSAPLGGCMLLSALLNDRIFALHTQETFNIVFPPKVDAFRALESATDLSRLDFVVVLSSISGMFGNPGQTNYAACVPPVTLCLQNSDVRLQCEHGHVRDGKEVQERCVHCCAGYPRYPRRDLVRCRLQAPAAFCISMGDECSR